MSLRGECIVSLKRYISIYINRTEQFTPITTEIVEVPRNSPFRTTRTSISYVFILRRALFSESDQHLDIEAKESKHTKKIDS